MSAAEFDPAARAEFLAAVEYYEECQEGLGRRFRLTVESAVDRICEMPFRFRVMHTPFRRCLVPTFPCPVIFSIEPEFILAKAASSRRSPKRGDYATQYHTSPQQRVALWSAVA